MNVSFFGRLTRDAEIKTGKSGANFTSFTVATNVRAKGNDGKAKAVFVDVTAFGKTGETICQYFHKGSRIVVHGEVQDISAWQGKNDGSLHANVNVTLNGFDFVDTQAESQQQAQGSYAPPQQAAPPQQGGYAYQPPTAPAGYAGQAPQAPPPAQAQAAAPWGAPPAAPAVPPAAPQYQTAPY